MMISPLIRAWLQEVAVGATAYSRTGSATMVPLSDANGPYTMSKTMTLERVSDAVSANDVGRAQRVDDKAMLKAAAGLTRDLNIARPAIYWADMVGSALLGYAALAATVAAGS